MVFLTMTSSMVEALENIQSIKYAAEEVTISRSRKEDKELGNDNDDEPPEQTTTDRGVVGVRETVKKDSGSTDEDLRQETAGKKITKSGEPSLENPKVGNPISHSQAIDLSKQLKARGISPCNLNILLRGAKVYVPPPSPKAEPTSEYKALMARLRREEEARSYDRMTNPPPPMETFSQRFPASSAAHAFDSNFYPTAPSDPFAEKDEVTYADVDRQMALILNVLLSIVACAGAIWVAARWWSTPARLALSMSGSILVGIAEVVVYSGYLRRVGESKGKEKAVKEVKEVMKTWVVGGGEERETENSTTIKSKENPDDIKARRRKKEAL